MYQSFLIFGPLSRFFLGRVLDLVVYQVLLAFNTIGSGSFWTLWGHLSNGEGGRGGGDVRFNLSKSDFFFEGKGFGNSILERQGKGCHFSYFLG